jgi:hypothetical protein
MEFRLKVLRIETAFTVNLVSWRLKFSSDLAIKKKELQNGR